MRIVLLMTTGLMLMSSNALAEEMQTSGICGETAEDCSWRYEDGKLTVTGNGEMSDFETYANQPWSQWKDDITQIEMSGITTLGRNAFSIIHNVKEVTIPATVEVLNTGCLVGMLSVINFENGSNLKRIEGYALPNNPQLTKFELPDSVEYIGYTEFWDTGISSIVLPESLFKNGKIGLAEDSLMSGMTIYCPKEHQQECEDYLKTATGLKRVDGKNTYPPLENMTLQTYEKDGDGYFINGSWYKHPNDVLTGKRIKKLRYTVEEAMKATEKGDKFHVFLTYK